MNELHARIESVSSLTDTVRCLRLKPTSPDFEFEPGQYVALVLHAGGEEQVRYYSIASTAQEDGAFELCVAATGQGSALIHELAPGAEITLRGPGGKMRLRKPVDRPLVFVASGTGISPLRAMIHELRDLGTGQPVTLLLGARDESSILFCDEFAALTSALPGFRFAPTLSQPDAGWTGLIGRVQDHVASHLVDDCDVYICGHSDMVNEVRALLETRQHDLEHVHYERY